MAKVLLDRIPPVKMDTSGDGSDMRSAAVLKSGVETPGRSLFVS